MRRAQKAPRARNSRNGLALGRSCKFRAFSAPEGKGDYFVGLFFGASFPTGNRPNGTGHTVLSPMLAMSKGWGTFSIQNTFGGNLPTSGTNLLGRAFLWNTAFQYGIKGKALAHD